jgi:hypothetical protein
MVIFKDTEHGWTSGEVARVCMLALGISDEKRTHYHCYYNESSFLHLEVVAETPSKRQQVVLSYILEQFPNYTFTKIEIFDTPSIKQACDEKHFGGVRRLDVA